jgi:hypothetical protein
VGLGEHACAILSNDSSLRCWGENARGQLGYGDTVTLYAPKDVPVVFPPRPAVRGTEQRGNGNTLSNCGIVGVVIGGTCGAVAGIVIVIRTLRRKRSTQRIHS